MAAIHRFWPSSRTACGKVVPADVSCAVQLVSSGWGASEYKTISRNGRENILQPPVFHINHVGLRLRIPCIRSAVGTCSESCAALSRQLPLGRLPRDVCTPCSANSFPASFLFLKDRLFILICSLTLFDLHFHRFRLFCLPRLHALDLKKRPSGSSLTHRAYFEFLCIFQSVHFLCGPQVFVFFSL